MCILSETKEIYNVILKLSLATTWMAKMAIPFFEVLYFKVKLFFIIYIKIYLLLFLYKNLT